MPPTKTLPEDYQQVYRLSLIKNTATIVWLQVAAVILAILFWGGFSRTISWMRPDLAAVRFTWTLPEIPQILIALALMILLHEAVHGAFFWYYTKERPKFGFKLAYAYAAAPDWYLPRNQFIVVGLAPLALLSLFGVLFSPLFPLVWVKGLVFFLTLNAAGAVGDMLTVMIVLRYPADAMVNDLGEEFTVFSR